ncbi:MAG: hypothetical protein ABR915_01845 [Thermoguttaceae bacterium]
MDAWIKNISMTIVYAAAVATARAEEGHPRILVTKPLLEAIRAEARKPGSHHQQVYKAIKERVEASYKNMAQAYGSEESEKTLKPDDYAWGYRARETAFLAMLAMTPEEQKKYAELSYKAAMETALPGGAKASSLAGAMGAMSIALAYDWSCHAWTPEQRAEVRKRAMTHLGAMLGGRGKSEIGFNKGGVINGSQLVLMIALGEETNRKANYGELKSRLKQHMETACDQWGVSQEGPGYTEYPASFLLPAVFAARQLGDDDLMKVAATRSWWKLLMYGYTFMEQPRRSVMWGVGSGASVGQGWASLLLWTVPPDQLPYYLWWYNRNQGVKAAVKQKFDPERGNSPFAMICYPIGVEEKDPSGVFPAAYYDELRGFALLRNRWKDWNDIQVTISADAIHGIIGWDQPDVLALNLLAYNTRFLGGPIKTHDIKNYSSLLVDGRFGSGSSTGKPDTFELRKDGGYAIVDGGELYAGLKCDSAKRHLLVQFAADKSQALLSTMDRIKSSASHTYTWQGNLGGPVDDDGVKSTGGQEAGRPMFLLKGRNNGFVKGWVVHPADAVVEAAGDPLRINVKGGDADIWVVMLVGQGEPPAATIAGSGLESVVTVAGNKVRFDAKANRVKAE